MSEDPYIVYNDEMKAFAKKLFDEAEALGYTSIEDKARYLSGRIFEISPFGVYEGVMDKNAIELFDGLMSDDSAKHYLACVNKAILQRGLLESQGIKTRNKLMEVVPFTYAFKPSDNAEIKYIPDVMKRMNDVSSLAIKPLVKSGLLFSFPHLTTDVCTKENESGECEEWKTMDATFDDTTRMLKIKPVPDKRFSLYEDNPETIDEWYEEYVYTKPAITLLLKVGDKPPISDFINWVFNIFWFNPLMQANEHIKKAENSKGVL
jgi:hypothetical protein